MKRCRSAPISTVSSAIAFSTSADLVDRGLGLHGHVHAAGPQSGAPRAAPPPPRAPRAGPAAGSRGRRASAPPRRCAGPRSAARRRDASASRIAAIRTGSGPSSASWRMPGLLSALGDPDLLLELRHQLVARRLQQQELGARARAAARRRRSPRPRRGRAAPTAPAATTFAVGAAARTSRPRLPSGPAASLRHARPQLEPESAIRSPPQPYRPNPGSAPAGPASPRGRGASGAPRPGSGGVRRRCRASVSRPPSSTSVRERRISTSVSAGEDSEKRLARSPRAPPFFLSSTWTSRVAR